MSNEAAWISEPRAPLKTGPAELYTPGPDEVVVKIHSVAINPMEAMIQRLGIMLDDFPAILGSDGAGEIHSVGSNVKGLVPGDRVIGCFDGVPPFPKADYRRNSFQRYAVAKAHLTTKLPSAVSFSEGSVLPLCVSSAADALFSDHGMELERPQLGKSPKRNGKTAVVWGGSSSIGTSAIQLLVSAGYEVVALAGARNHELCRSLGAKHVFDHASPTVIEDLVKALRDTDVEGVFSAIMSKEAMEKTIELYVKLGSKGKIGSMMPPGFSSPCEIPSGVDVRRGTLTYVA